ncbi:MAG: hypothetical protein WCJ35_15260 [Planctomycetota bacterium]
MFHKIPVRGLAVWLSSLLVVIGMLGWVWRRNPSTADVLAEYLTMELSGIQQIEVSEILLEGKS